MPDPDLRSLIADLREASRWPRTHPDEAARMAERLCERLHESRRLVGDQADRMLCRLGNNLAAAARFVRSNPDMLAAYLRAAADEIEAYADGRREEGSGNA